MPLTKLRVAAIPIDMKLGMAADNLDFIENRLDSLDPETDLVVLPEMCTTGYTLDPRVVESYVETVDGPSITRLRQMARSHGMALWGTFACIDGNRLYNRGFMIDPSGETRFYDKRHLFVLGREPMLYSPGQQLPPVVSFRGWKLMMAVCYDLRFPAWCRWTASRPYDALIIPANWPDARAFAWKHLLIARAVENQAYVVGCNRLGEDPYGIYHEGITHIFNHWGDDVADRSAPGVVSCVFDGEALERDRKRFPNLQVADDFRILL